MNNLWLLIHRAKSPPGRFAVYLILFIWINSINFFIFYHRHSAIDRLTATINSVNPLNNYDGHAIPKKLVDNLAIQLWLKKSNNHLPPSSVDIHDSNYDSLFSKHSVESILKLDYPNRCDAFFTNLYVKNPGWSLGVPDRFRPPGEILEKWDDYKKVHWDDVKLLLEEKFKKQKNNNNDPKKVPDSDIENHIRNSFNKLHEKVLENEALMLQQISQSRIYLRCYVEQNSRYSEVTDGKFVDDQRKYIRSFSDAVFQNTNDESNFLSLKTDSCTDLESRVFPWLSHHHPRYQRFSDHDQAVVPKMAEYAEKALMRTNNARYMPSKSPILSKLTGDRACWLNRFKLELNGRGIVVPVDEVTVGHATRLIRVLRALGNGYPIQIVSFGALLDSSKEKLRNAARSPIYDLPNSYNAIAEHLPYELFHSDDRSLRQQELWFVDASSAIAPGYRSHFVKAPLLAIASFANSFQEYILMSPLAIPLKQPSYFFKLSDYKSTGAFFYHSRPVSLRKSEKDVTWLLSMAPSAIDTTVFNIPMMTGKSRGLLFFSGLEQVQDSGMAIVNKARHFNTIMTLVQLSLYWPVAEKGNIAQEHWLAFALSGDDKYTFSNHLPGVIGDSSQNTICSAQIGQMDGESGNLLSWINGGFQICPMEDISMEDEVSRAFKTFSLQQDLENYYRKKVEVKHVMIPPFEGLQSLTMEPWRTSENCKGMIYCGSLEVEKNGKKETGTVVELAEKEREMYEFLGDIWLDRE